VIERQKCGTRIIVIFNLHNKNCAKEHSHSVHDIFEIFFFFWQKFCKNRAIALELKVREKLWLGLTMHHTIKMHGGVAVASRIPNLDSRSRRMVSLKFKLLYLSGKRPLLYSRLGAF
jgi:hypothetical protein